MEKAILQLAGKFCGDPRHFRRQILADVKRRNPKFLKSTIASSYSIVLGRLRELQPERFAFLPKRWGRGLPCLPDGESGNGDEPVVVADAIFPVNNPTVESTLKLVETPMRAASVRVITVQDGIDTESEGSLPANYGWDGLEEDDRQIWVRQIILNGSTLPESSIFFRASSGATLRLGIVCSMSVRDLCLAGLHAVAA